MARPVWACVAVVDGLHRPACQGARTRAGGTAGGGTLAGPSSAGTAAGPRPPGRPRARSPHGRRQRARRGGGRRGHARPRRRHRLVPVGAPELEEHRVQGGAARGAVGGAALARRRRRAEEGAAADCGVGAGGGMQPAGGGASGSLVAARAAGHHTSGSAAQPGHAQPRPHAPLAGMAAAPPSCPAVVGRGSSSSRNWRRAARYGCRIASLSRPRPVRSSASAASCGNGWRGSRSG